MRIADDLRTHTVEDVNARLIDMVADKLLDRAFGAAPRVPLYLGSQCYGRSHSDFRLKTFKLLRRCPAD